MPQNSPADEYPSRLEVVPRRAFVSGDGLSLFILEQGRSRLPKDSQSQAVSQPIPPGSAGLFPAVKVSQYVRCLGLKSAQLQTRCFIRALGTAQCHNETFFQVGSIQL